MSDVDDEPGRLPIGWSASARRSQPTGDVVPVSAPESPGDRCVRPKPGGRQSSRNVSDRTRSKRPAHRSCFECFACKRSGRVFASRGRATRPGMRGEVVRALLQRGRSERPRRVAGFHPGPFFPPLPAVEGGLSTSLGLGTPLALLGQRLADTAEVINPELLSRLGAASVPGSAPACAAGPRTTAAVALGRPGPQAARPGALIGLPPPQH